MCGISGMIGLEAGDATVEKMLGTMSRRGPDSSGIYRNGQAVLLHARLAVIDLQGGRQPMVLNHQGETYGIVYNGELYNTEEVRQRLLRAGHRFLGHSDTEVVLHAYAEFGADCLQQLNGIFAFGVWEETKKRLFLARDRIGVKPLFYSSQAGLSLLPKSKPFWPIRISKPGWRKPEQGSCCFWDLDGCRAAVF